MTTSDPIPRTRHVKRWGVAAAASVSVCGLWFAYLNWDGCWLFLRGTRGLITFVPFCLWLLLLLGFRVMGRLVLIALTLVGLVFLPHIHGVRVAAAEVSAVGRLRELHSALESYKMENGPSSYPEGLPSVGSAYPLQRTYRFEYVPSRSPNAAIAGYLIKATPQRLHCGCKRSFTIADDGHLYYTLQERAATVSDELLP